MQMSSVEQEARQGVSGMADTDLRRTSHKVRGTKNAWWYEEARGISVIVHRDAIQPSGAAEINIPWRQLRAALSRKERGKE